MMASSLMRSVSVVVMASVVVMVPVVVAGDSSLTVVVSL